MYEHVAISGTFLNDKLDKYFLHLTKTCFRVYQFCYEWNRNSITRFLLLQVLFFLEMTEVEVSWEVPNFGFLVMSDVLGCDLQNTEPQFSTKFMILSAHYLVDAYMLSEGKCQRYLWLALDRLTEASSGPRALSPVDSQILIVILRLSHHLGLIIPCSQLMDKMQIKQFILQTTGWLISNRLVSCAAFEEAHLFHSTIMKYVQSSIQTVPDFVIQAYRNGAFRKVCDMLQWKQTLVKSYTFIKCVVEETVLDFATEISECVHIIQVVIETWHVRTQDPLNTRELGCHTRNANMPLIFF